MRPRSVRCFMFSLLCAAYFVVQIPLVSLAQMQFRLFPLAQSVRNDLHPDFSTSEWGLGFAGERLWFVYDSEVGAGNTEVFIRSKARYIPGWSEPTQLTSNIASDRHPNVEVYEDKVVVVWETNRGGNLDLMYVTCDGDDWTEPLFLTRDVADDTRPILLGLRPWQPCPRPHRFVLVLVWERAGRLHFSQFADSSWLTPQPVSTGQAIQSHPFLSGDDRGIWLVWQGSHNDDRNIFGSKFDPDGNSWSPAQQISFSDSSDTNPTIIKGSWPESLCHVVWQSTRDGQEDLYSKEWWSDSDSTYLSEPIKLTVHDSSDTEPWGLWVPHG